MVPAPGRPIPGSETTLVGSNSLTWRDFLEPESERVRDAGDFENAGDFTGSVTSFPQHKAQTGHTHLPPGRPSLTTNTHSVSLSVAFPISGAPRNLLRRV